MWRGASGRGRGRGRGRGGGGRGRGCSYYQDKYGGGSGGSGGLSRGQDRGDPASFRALGDGVAMAAFLRGIDNASYPLYKGLIGEWRFADRFCFYLDRCQGDPYAAPSRARVRVALKDAGFSPQFTANRVRTAAFCDFLTRRFWTLVHDREMDQIPGGGSGGWSGPKGGNINVDKPSQHVLERTSCLVVDEAFIELRFTVALPARGRSIDASLAVHILTEQLPVVVTQTLFASSVDLDALKEHVLSVEDQEYLRNTLLQEHDLVAFVADDAVLPRVSGASDAPMEKSKAIKFKSPPSLAVTMKLPSGRQVVGMGIHPGVSLICGAGFHGKSTLLAALVVGCYNHIPGDGREFVCVDSTTASIRAEDGRSVLATDLTPFINGLPFDKQTSKFSTPDASGSTSQGANIMEALEAGARALLIDEDNTASNAMVSSRAMKELVAQDTITPMLQRVQPLHKELGVSTILVIGGAGEYFEVADLVLQMTNYTASDVTSRAREIAKRYPSGLDLNADNERVFRDSYRRCMSVDSVRATTQAGKMFVRVKNTVQFGETELDLSGLPQIVEVSQTRAIAYAIEAMGNMSIIESEGVTAVCKKLDAGIQAQGLDSVNSRGERLGTFARPRRMELQCALNRLRGLASV